MIDCSDQLLREEIISLTYSIPLRVNLCVAAYFVQAQVKLALEFLYRLRNVFGKVVP